MESPPDTQNDPNIGFTETVESSAIAGGNVAIDTDTRTGLIRPLSEARASTGDSPLVSDEEGEEGMNDEEEDSEEGSDEDSNSEGRQFLDLFDVEGIEYPPG